MDPETEFRIELSDEPAEADQEIFLELRRYNAERVGTSDYRELTVLLRDASGAVVGGLRGSTGKTWLHVATLVVREAQRRQGGGSRLLEAAEREAVARGCLNAYLDTFSFQARPFYEKHGYVVFGTLEDFPPGHERYFLRKRLAAG